MELIFFAIVIYGLIAFLFARILLDAEKQQQQEIFDTQETFPYYKKPYFFSRSEQEFFNILNSKLDAHQHTVFCKVRLEDFINISPAERWNRTWRNKIRAKHIDFMIWNLVTNEIIFLVELDGNSHNSVKATNRDMFVNLLYEKIGIKLEHVRVGTNFYEEIDRILSKHL